MSVTITVPLPPRKLFGFVVSCAVHLAVFLVGGVLLVKPIQYGVDQGLSSIEVSLVAAPAPIETPPAPVEPVVAPSEPEPIPLPLAEPEPDPLPDPVPPPVVMKPEVPRIEPPLMPKTQTPVAIKKEVAPPIKKTPLPVPKVLPEKGDGSASVPGKSPATAQSAAGALIEAKPEYFKNPPPKYPYLAKQKGWEGTVLLNVDVDKAGKPLRITLEQSSGHQVLDDAAFKALKKWQFRPALLGDIPVDSTVRVPVRFVLQ